MTEVEIVPVDEQKLEKAVAKAIINLEKKDYRATIVQRMEQGEPPDALTAFIDIDEDKKNLFGFNRDLDVKGSLGPYDLYFNKQVRFATILAELKDWMYVEREDDEGNKVKIPVDLMQLDAEEGRWLNLSFMDRQSNKEIRLMRAGVGLPEETGFGERAAQFMGFSQRKKKDEVYE